MVEFKLELLSLVEVIVMSESELLRSELVVVPWCCSCGWLASQGCVMSLSAECRIVGSL